MLDIQRVDPALAPGKHANQKAQLHQLRLGKVPFQFRPQRVVRLSRIPCDGIGVTQRGAFAVRKQRRFSVVCDLRNLVFADRLLS